MSNLNVEGDDGSKKSHATITQDYRGFIQGTSETHYLMSYQTSSTALFVGFEVITGEIKGKSGSFTVQHNGTFENGVASSEFIIVANSGTGQFSNIEGSGSFKSGDAGQATYELISNL